ncbi:MAG: succinate dehydrogenase, cytochrome b556 subunit, partial [Pseudomonadota bacterium]|nr:succinate dehydrogenase, cytochrome b556 subunit [Pseudomonadota bacterium]
RITGVALSVGLVALVAWLAVIAYDFIPYDPVLTFMRSLPGRVVLFGFSFAFFFHLSNGIRHLIWDTGRLFEKRQVDTSAWIVLLASVSMTLFYWFVW